MKDLKGRLKNTEKKTVILGVLGLTLLTGAAVTATTIITGNTQPDGHELNATTLDPVQVTPTEAEFKANLTDLDSIYDAALIKWNYTNTDTGETFKGPANIAFQEGETVKRLQPNLNASQQYRINTYTEPVIWEDDKLAENVIESGQAMEGIKQAIEGITASKQAMEAIASRIIARTAVISIQNAEETIWSSEIASKEILKELEPSPPHNYAGTDAQSSIVDNLNGGKALQIEVNSETDRSTSEATLKLNLTDYDTLKLDHYRNSVWGNLNIFVGDDRVFNGGEKGWNTMEIDISSYQGQKNVRFQVKEKRGGIERSHKDKITNITLR